MSKIKNMVQVNYNKFRSLGYSKKDALVEAKTHVLLTELTRRTRWKEEL